MSPVESSVTFLVSIITSGSFVSKISLPILSFPLVMKLLQPSLGFCVPTMFSEKYYSIHLKYVIRKKNTVRRSKNLTLLSKIPLVFRRFPPSLRLHAADVVPSAFSSVVLLGKISWILTIVDL